MIVSTPICASVECVRLTTNSVDWADLVTLDLSQYDAPGGKQRLAAQLRDAVHHVGFLYVSHTFKVETSCAHSHLATLPTSVSRKMK